MSTKSKKSSNRGKLKRQTAAQLPDLDPSKAKKKQARKTVLAQSLKRMRDTRLRIRHRDITIIQALHEVSVELDYVRSFVLPTIAELKPLKLTPCSRHELHSAYALTHHMFKHMKDYINDLKEAVKEVRKEARHG